MKNDFFCLSNTAWRSASMDGQYDNPMLVCKAVEQTFFLCRFHIRNLSNLEFDHNTCFDVMDNCKNVCAIPTL